MASGGGSTPAEGVNVSGNITDERNHVNGVCRRKCICANPLCREIFAFWCTAVDEKETPSKVLLNVDERMVLLLFSVIILSISVLIDENEQQYFVHSCKHDHDPT